MASSTAAKRLIEYASCGGCSGKIPVQVVAQVVKDLPRFGDPNLLVGAEHFSDAGVYRLRDDLAIVNTVDFFPPMVDDPYLFGQIAAANALSDIYATGAEPKTALNIVCYPDDQADPALLHKILEGATERVQAADTVVVGGHSLRDKEIKFGLALTGVVDPSRMFTNAGAQPGDALVLTKGLGAGLAIAAYRNDACPEVTLNAATASMITLNRGARDAAIAVGAHGVTDVTGFGLAGHANEMAQASNVAIHIDVASLPKIVGTESLARDGHLSRATKTNREFVENVMSISEQVDAIEQAFLFDAQTSGGLLISATPDRARQLVEQCQRSDLPLACIIGHVEARIDSSLVIM